MVATKPAAAALIIALTLIPAVAVLAAGDPPGNSPTSYVGPLPHFKTRVVFSLWASAWGGQGGVVTVELWYQKDGGAWKPYGDPIPYPWVWQFNTSLTGGDGRRPGDRGGRPSLSRLATPPEAHPEEQSAHVKASSRARPIDAQNPETPISG